MSVDKGITLGAENSLEDQYLDEIAICTPPTLEID